MRLSIAAWLSERVPPSRACHVAAE